MHSDDDAGSWSPVRDVTEEVKPRSRGWGWVATTFNGLQLRYNSNYKGRLLVAAGPPYTVIQNIYLYCYLETLKGSNWHRHVYEHTCYLLHRSPSWPVEELAETKLTLVPMPFR